MGLAPETHHFKDPYQESILLKKQQAWRGRSGIQNHRQEQPAGQPLRLINTLHCMDQLAEGKWDIMITPEFRDWKSSPFLLQEKNFFLIFHSCKHIHKNPTALEWTQYLRR